MGHAAGTGLSLSFSLSAGEDKTPGTSAQHRVGRAVRVVHARRGVRDRAIAAGQERSGSYST